MLKPFFLSSPAKWSRSGRYSQMVEQTMHVSAPYYRARYYDLQIGRFLSEDALRFNTGANFYSYVKNSPVSLRDPTGHLA